MIRSQSAVSLLFQRVRLRSVLSKADFLATVRLLSTLCYSFHRGTQTQGHAHSFTVTRNPSVTGQINK